jgi:hypothetical protein
MVGKAKVRKESDYQNCQKGHWFFPQQKLDKGTSKKYNSQKLVGGTKFSLVKNHPFN